MAKNGMGRRRDKCPPAPDLKKTQPADRAVQTPYLGVAASQKRIFFFFWCGSLPRMPGKKLGRISLGQG